VQRLKEYQARLILFPRKAGQHKNGDSSKEEVSAAKNTVTRVEGLFPIAPVDKVIHEIKKGDMPKATEGGAHRRLRNARAEKKHIGAIEKRRKDAAAAEDASKK
jgi:large subunit ribosomal protein L13e